MVGKTFPHCWKQRRWQSVIVAFLITIMLSWGIMPAVAWARTETPTTNRQSIQPYLDQVIKQVSEFRLDNGIKFLVLERHRAPVISFLTYADVGGVDEPDGKTGVAHFLEHLAFKGSKRIGTTDYQAEKQLLFLRVK
ncbi:MAG: insulinase family protein [Merismopedia sp. SIO2A8]|nr:insulinase family protein [Merismopedia sp. SIO2A8]